MKHKVALLAGDGIGPELMACAKKVLNKVSRISAFEFEDVEGEIGGAAYDKYKQPFPIQTKRVIDACDAVLLGGVGGYKWDDVSPELRPEKGLLELRKYMKVYSNIRPVRLIKGLEHLSPLKAEIISRGVDMCLVRELTGAYILATVTAVKNKGFDMLVIKNIMMKMKSNVLLLLDLKWQ